MLIVSHTMDSIESLRARIEALELELRQSKEKIAELRRDKDDAEGLVGQMREHLEDARAARERWIEAFEMVQNQAGAWTFPSVGERLWSHHAELLEKHNKLVRDWNRYVGKFNSIVRPRPPGRRLEASEAQAADVLKRRKAGQSLRAIAAATHLGLSTVRTIITRKQRTAELRKREFDKQRATAFRSRKKLRDGIPKRLAEEIKDADRLIKVAKGL